MRGLAQCFGILSHGLPSVALPQGADNFGNGAMMAEAGTTVHVAPDQVSAEAITAALRAVMGHPGYRQRAEHAADEMRAMASPTDVAEMLATRFGPKP